MTVLITETLRGEHGTYVQATCGNVSALVGIHSHGLQVTCQNASHRVWRKSGRHFPDIEAARAHYRSGEMRAIIHAAVEAATPSDA